MDKMNNTYLEKQALVCCKELSVYDAAAMYTVQDKKDFKGTLDMRMHFSQRSWQRSPEQHEIIPGAGNIT
jgi:hypothetical protein